MDGQRQNLKSTSSERILQPLGLRPAERLSQHPQAPLLRLRRNLSRKTTSALLPEVPWVVLLASWWSSASHSAAYAGTGRRSKQRETVVWLLASQECTQRLGAVSSMIGKSVVRVMWQRLSFRSVTLALTLVMMVFLTTPQPGRRH